MRATTVLLISMLLLGIVAVGRALADADASAPDASISADAGTTASVTTPAPGPTVKAAPSPSLLAQLKAFYCAHAPWILGVLMPSIVVALTASPKTKGLGDRLKWLLGLFSLVTHYDSATSFKLPLLPVPAAPPDPPKPEQPNAN